MLSTVVIVILVLAAIIDTVYVYKKFTAAWKKSRYNSANKNLKK